ncbi:PTS sugar transporter subunit IIB [Garciella nitratireducens]|uniref:PTS sugar transporter subunit IIB n=1 Tax=Garciella nitratireducens TaxID=218205 RepID=UPI001BD4860C|nr:PTS sugar transporter subunit IIB [Garciella nitratireducens]
MSRTYHVLIVCADGAATSTMALVALREGFEDKGLSVDLSQGRVADIALTVEHGNYDAIISTAGTDLDLPRDIPIFSGIPFLTGIGKEQLLEEIIKTVQK